MKNMKKVLAVMTAVSAMTASTSAFAATTVGETDASSIITFTQAVKNDEGAVTTGNSIAVDAMPAGIVDGEVTLLVLDYATVETAVADDDILYIDQGTYANSTNPFAGKALGLKVSDIVAAAEAQFATDSAADETLATKTYSYPVKLGYYVADEFAIATASVDVTIAKDAEGGEVKTVNLTYGNIDCDTDGALDVADAIAVLGYGVSGVTQTFGAIADTFDGFTLGTAYTTSDGVEFKYGNIDCDTDGALDVADAIAILGYGVSGVTQEFNGLTLGTTYQIVVE